MKPKNLLIILTTLLLCLSVVKPSAWAGNVQRNRWEGVAIGAGAALLGTAILHHFRYSEPALSPVKRHHPPPRYGHQRRQAPSGYWEIRKVWVPPTHERVWNPGHYDRKGRWAPGEWISIEKEPGYWAKEKIWVCRE
jgi:hypothetical protein